MEQGILHLIGDYLFQTDWMANNKTKKLLPAFLHALFYSGLFLLIASPLSVFVIFISHLLIDRFRLVKYILRIKEWNFKNEWGYITEGKDAKPPYMWIWLMIIADNTLHLICNYFAIKYL